MDKRINHLRLLYALLLRRLRYPRARLWVKGDDGQWHDADTGEVRR